jgi:hypothetical protein
MTPSARREAFHLLTGELLGSGVARKVYACELFPDCVVKVEDGAGSYQNVLEWEIWKAVKDTKFARWFAPCRYIGPSGIILIMERTQPAQREQFPDKVPAFLTDLKRQNFGMLNGRLVAHDYGLNLLLEHGMTSRLRRAQWWDA